MYFSIRLKMELQQGNVPDNLKPLVEGIIQELLDERTESQEFQKQVEQYLNDTNSEGYEGFVDWLEEK